MISSTKNTLQIVLVVLFFHSCKNKTDENTAEQNQTGTPVTVTTIVSGPLSENVELNATSVFLLKTPVKSIANGYIQDLKIKQGDYVNKGAILFSIKTKEAESVGNSINNIDTSFHFKGVTTIVAQGSGYITQLNFQSGGYVQDGEQIATIGDEKSFAFILDLPYEMTSLLKSNKNVQLLLPDGTKLNGTLQRPMPDVDAVSQTQRYLISVNENKLIPENLIAKVSLVKYSKQNVLSLPKEAILTDETQNNFWVMKLLNDTTSVKVTVQKGIETNTSVEIISPQFTAQDKFLLTGNYGLPDTAKIQLSK